jgi:hypothetical protein
MIYIIRVLLLEMFDPLVNVVSIMSLTWDWPSVQTQEEQVTVMSL